MRCLGVDLGGSGFRLGVFEVETGTLLSKWQVIDHQEDTGPTSVIPNIRDSILDIGWSGPIGVGFPGMVSDNRIMTAPNLGEEWLKFDLKKELGHLHNGSFSMINDADAVAVTEYNLGSSRNKSGRVLTVTIGTGIGTTIQDCGAMVPNLELGRMPHPRLDCSLESYISARARIEEDLSIERWAERFQEGLEFLERLTNPDLIILYGGIMEHWADFSGLISTKAQIEPAKFDREAGALGAAIVASRL